MEAKFWIELIAVLTVPITIVAVIFHRVKSEMGMGVRSLQFLAIGAVLPIVLILALERILDTGAIGAIFGAVIGYLFSTAAKESGKT